MKTINFKAIEVDYSEAIGGEIVQVTFDEDLDDDPDEDPFERTKCYVMISQNYEFPTTPSLEWHDGLEYNGGSEVLNYKLTSDLFELELSNATKFIVKHNCSKEIFNKICKFFQREFGKSK